MVGNYGDNKINQTNFFSILELWYLCFFISTPIVSEFLPWYLYDTIFPLLRSSFLLSVTFWFHFVIPVLCSRFPLLSNVSLDNGDFPSDKFEFQTLIPLLLYRERGVALLLLWLCEGEFISFHGELEGGVFLNFFSI